MTLWIFTLLLLTLAFGMPLDEDVDDLTTTVASEVEEEVTETPTTSLPTFAVERLDAPIERIEIRLIDDNSTKTTPTEETTVSSTAEPTQEHEEEEELIPTGSIERRVEEVRNDEITTTEHPAVEDSHYHKGEYMVLPKLPKPTLSTTEEPVSTTIGNNEVHVETEEVAVTAEPAVVGHLDGYYSTEATATIQAKAWISYSTSATVPKFEGDIDEDDLPPPPMDTNLQDESEPTEECLSNSENLSTEVVQKLKDETANLYRLVKQRNDLQKEHCRDDPQKREDRRCSDWRSEKLVYYYKLMRKTYCQVDRWPNTSKVKKTYGEYLNLFGTFYAFQK